RNWNSGNWHWTGRQLRLSPFRIRVLSPRGVLLPATRLWVLRRTVILWASRASSALRSQSLGGPNQHELTSSLRFGFSIPPETVERVIPFDDARCGGW